MLQLCGGCIPLRYCFGLAGLHRFDGPSYRFLAHCQRHPLLWVDAGNHGLPRRLDHWFLGLFNVLLRENLAARTMIALVLSLYVLAVLGVGVFANRAAGSSPESYFLAGRSLGTVVLFMALFGTNATAFVLVGIPGKAYHGGIETFGLNAPMCTLGIPLLFWLIGSPARKMGARLQAITPVEIFVKRFDAPRLGYIFVAFFVLYTLPYMVTAVKGAAITLDGVTDGA